MITMERPSPKFYNGADILPFVLDELAELYPVRGDTLAADHHRAEAERLRG